MHNSIVQWVTQQATDNEGLADFFKIFASQQQVRQLLLKTAEIAGLSTCQQDFVLQNRLSEPCLTRRFQPGLEFLSCECFSQTTKFKPQRFRMAASQTLQSRQPDFG